MSGGSVKGPGGGKVSMEAWSHQKQGKKRKKGEEAVWQLWERLKLHHSMKGR